jgi:hypothetical protein
LAGPAYDSPIDSGYLNDNRLATRHLCAFTHHPAEVQAVAYTLQLVLGQIFGGEP